MKRAPLLAVLSFMLLARLHAADFNVKWVSQGTNPICSISLTSEAVDGSRSGVQIYEDVDGLKKISGAFGKFADWHFKSNSDKLGPVTKAIDDVKGLPFRGATGSHIILTFNRHDDGTNTCVMEIVNGADVTEETPAFKALLIKAWIDNMIKEATDPDRISKAKRAEDDLK